MAFGLIVQGYSVRSLRRSLDWLKLWPFLLGATIGVPVGVTLLTWADPHKLRVGIGLLGAKETVTLETVKLFLIGLPFLIAGTWLGLKLFGRLNEAAFRKRVLALLFASGAALSFSAG